jgi:hypothetical protein
VNNSGSSTVPNSGVLNHPLVVVSARRQSITGTAATTARAMSGCWVFGDFLFERVEAGWRRSP